ncbi:MAG TPA: hypothetical protein VHB69_04625 [Mycobacteriales bacterium]|nr:hypothetical protein [Mycobacteriales bacterium]
MAKIATTARRGQLDAQPVPRGLSDADRRRIRAEDRQAARTALGPIVRLSRRRAVRNGA